MIFALSCRTKSNNSEKVYCVNIGVYMLTQFKSHKKHDLTKFSLPKPCKKEFLESPNTRIARHLMT